MKTEELGVIYNKSTSMIGNRPRGIHGITYRISERRAWDITLGEVIFIIVRCRRDIVNREMHKLLESSIGGDVWLPHDLYPRIHLGMKGWMLLRSIVSRHCPRWLRRRRRRTVASRLFWGWWWWCQGHVLNGPMGKSKPVWLNISFICASANTDIFLYNLTFRNEGYSSVYCEYLA